MVMNLEFSRRIFEKKNI